MVKKEKVVFTEEAQNLSDQGIDRLTADIIKDALDDVFCDVDEKKREYLEALQNQQDAIVFFKSEDSWFKLCNLDLQYLLKKYPAKNDYLREKAIDTVNMYPMEEVTKKLHTPDWLYAHYAKEALKDNLSARRKEEVDRLVFHLKKYTDLIRYDIKRKRRKKAIESKINDNIKKGIKNSYQEDLDKLLELTKSNTNKIQRKELYDGLMDILAKIKIAIEVEEND